LIKKKSDLESYRLNTDDFNNVFHKQQPKNKEELYEIIDDPSKEGELFK